MAINLTDLLTLNKPEVSEKRFQNALLSAAEEEDALILHTQIARTYGLRGDFAHAQQILAEIEPQVQISSSLVRVHYHLEWGRAYCSAAHPPETLTAEARELARWAYLRALALAQEERLEHLAIDVLHMLAFVDPAPADQIAWNHKAIAILQASNQPEVQKWAGPLHNNLGCALHLLGRYDEALAEFAQALSAQERDGSPQTVRIAHWMIAWTLRSQGRLNEALAIQLRLEDECDLAGEPDPYVFEELRISTPRLTIPIWPNTTRRASALRPDKRRPGSLGSIPALNFSVRE